MRWLWWPLMLLLALGLKQYYSAANELQLQWMLRPLAMLAQLASGLRFAETGYGTWFNAEHGIAIVKSCAGLNFLILALLALAYRLRPGAGSSAASMIGSATICLLCAWLYTLAVNTIRIALAVQLYRHDIALLGLDADELHRIAGVLVYFPVLWFLFAVGGVTSIRRAGIAASVLYLAMVVGVPVLTGNYLDHINEFAEHALVTTALVLLVVLPVALAGPVSRLRSNQCSCFHS